MKKCPRKAETPLREDIVNAGSLSNGSNKTFLGSVDRPNCFLSS